MDSHKLCTIVNGMSKNPRAGDFLQRGFLLFLHSLYNSLKSFYNKRLKCIYHFTADA